MASSPTASESRIYLDHHAATPMLPEAWEAMRPFLTESFGNPSSVHSAGRKARRALEDARERVAHLLQAYPDEVVFTSGATEANNLAVFGQAGRPPGHVLASRIEHPCVVEPLHELAARGFEVEWVSARPDGLVEAKDFVSRVRPDTHLVCLMRVNHETGAIQPVLDLPGTPIHTDAAQAVGKVPVSFRDLNVSTLSLSGHKFGGPKGVGALLVKRGTTLAPTLFGGPQQAGRRPGTEPVAQAVGLATALEIRCNRLEVNLEHMRGLRTAFVEQLQLTAPPVVVNGAADHSPYVVNLSFPGCRADLLLMKLDLAGVACSTGSACSSGSLRPSTVLQAMALPDELLLSALRFSFSPAQTVAEITDAAGRIALAVNDLRRGGYDGGDRLPQGGSILP